MSVSPVLFPALSPPSGVLLPRCGIEVLEVGGPRSLFWDGVQGLAWSLEAGVGCGGPLVFLSCCGVCV